MSDELRTPIGAILGFAELLMGGQNFTPKQLESLDIIHRSGQRLLDVMNNILFLSKIEADQTPVVHEAFNLFETLNIVNQGSHFWFELPLRDFTLPQHHPEDTTTQPLNPIL